MALKIGMHCSPYPRAYRKQQHPLTSTAHNYVLNNARSAQCRRRRYAQKLTTGTTTVAAATATEAATPAASGSKSDA